MTETKSCLIVTGTFYFFRKLGFFMLDSTPGFSSIIYGQAFRTLLFRALKRTVPLAAVLSFSFGCFIGIFVSDVPWMDRLIIGSPLFGRLLAIVLCPLVSVILADIFVGMEASMALLAAADKNLDDVWRSLGFSPHHIMVRTRRLTLYLTVLVLFGVSWFGVRYGFEEYLDWVAAKKHLVWMPLLADAPIIFGMFVTLLATWFVDRATLMDIRSAPIRNWPADKRWGFVLQRQFFALAGSIVVLGVSFLFFNHWTL